jgi:hypothetical protein
MYQSKERILVRLLFLLGLAPIVCSTASAQPPPGEPLTPCDPRDSSLVCLGQQEGPEDLLALPGGEWVIASSMSGDGGLALIRASDRMAMKAYPSAAAREQLDSSLYGECPGPPSAGRFTTHGLYVESGDGSVHRLLVVGHGDRESIEVFDVDMRESMPQLTWIGCVVAPDPIGLNSVRGLPDGGFLTTNFLSRGTDPAATQRMRDGERNGELWEWHPDSEWQKVPGSEAAGANGIELSDDGGTIYMAAWGSQSFVRLSRGGTPVQRDEVPLGFRVDNIHFSGDGSLLAVGQGTGEKARHTVAVKIDPETLAVREVLAHPDSAAFTAGTAAAEVGDRWWVGSFRGDRIAVLPAPP